MANRMKIKDKSDVSDACAENAPGFGLASESVGKAKLLESNKKSTVFPTFPTLFPTNGASVGNVGNPFRVSDVPTPQIFRQQKEASA